MASLTNPYLEDELAIGSRSSIGLTRAVHAPSSQRRTHWSSHWCS